MPKPTIGILYDFDKTLCTTDMQEYDFIKNLGMTSSAFWGEAATLTREHEVEKILAYMLVMIRKCKEKGIPLTEEYLKKCGEHVELFKGVSTWFDRINAFGEEMGVKIEHYIISSGTYEIIQGTPIAKYFKRIYACRSMYDENGEALWPALAINYTLKTQYIYRISKGVFDESDERVNDVIPRSERYIPYENIVYIGDSATDIPCMKLVSSKNGHAIGVYNPQLQNTAQVERLFREGRISFYAPADYREDMPLDTYLKTVIDEIAAHEATKYLEEQLP